MKVEKDCEGCPEKAGDSPSGPQEGKILVTGASGFVGRNLCKALVERGYKLRVLVRSDEHEAFFKALAAEIFTGDIRDGEVVDWACDGAEGIFHLASIVQKAGIADSEFWDVHVTATENLLKSAKKYGVRRFVHCSTIGVLGHIENPPADEATPYNVDDIYQTTKAEGEKAALEFHNNSGLPVTVVRPAAVYGPGDTRLLKLFKLVATGKFRMIGDGKTLIHPVYVDDLVDGMLKAYESETAPGNVYILGGEKYVTLTEWVGIIAEAAGVQPSSVRIPYAPVWAAAVLCEALFKPFGLEPPLFRRRVDFFVKDRAFCIDKARGELGYEPKTDLAQGAKRTVEWYKKEGWLKQG